MSSPEISGAAGFPSSSTTSWVAIGLVCWKLNLANGRVDLCSSYTRSNSFSQSLNFLACATLTGNRPNFARWDSWAGEIRVEGRLVGSPSIITSKLASNSVNIANLPLICLFIKMHPHIQIYASDLHYSLHFLHPLLVD